METLNFSALFFYAFSIAAIVFSILVVTSNQIFRAAVYLMFVLVFIAGFYLLLGAEFLAGIQILVYVGGIVVLIVFAVMLTTALKVVEPSPPLIRKIIAFFLTALFMGINFYALKMYKFNVVESNSSTELSEETLKLFGRKFLDMGKSGFIVPFEVVSILLLAALIGGIVIARENSDKKVNQ